MKNGDKSVNTLPVVNNGVFRISRDASVFAKDRFGRYQEITKFNTPHGQIVQVMRDGKQIKAYVHRLLAEAYIPNPDGKKKVVFLDGNKKNIDIENLAWASAAEANFHSRPATQEWFRDAIGGRFLVSPLGEVLACEGTEHVKLQHKTRSSDGYKYVDYNDNGRIASYGVHALVAEAHLPNDDPKRFVALGFRNGDISDVRAENLRWMTSEETRTASLIPCPSCGVHKIIRRDAICAHCYKQNQANRDVLLRGQADNPQDPPQNHPWDGLPELEGGLLRVSRGGDVYQKIGGTFKLLSYPKGNERPLVSVSVNGFRKRFFVHRLVALAYVDNPNPSRNTEVGFLNDDATDVCADNLKWMTKPRGRKASEPAPKKKQQPEKVVLIGQAEKNYSANIVAPTRDASDVHCVEEALASGYVRPAGREDGEFARDYAILQMRASGASYDEITEEFSLDVRQVRQVIDMRTLVYRTLQESSSQTA